MNNFKFNTLILIFISILFIVISPQHIHSKTNEEVTVSTHRWRVCTGYAERYDDIGIFKFYASYKKNLDTGVSYHSGSVNMTQLTGPPELIARVSGVSELANFVLRINYVVDYKYGPPMPQWKFIDVQTNGCQIINMPIGFVPQSVQIDK